MVRIAPTVQIVCVKMVQNATTAAFVEAHPVEITRVSATKAKIAAPVPVIANAMVAKLVKVVAVC